MSILKRWFGGKSEERGDAAVLRLRSSLVGAPLAMEPSKVETFLASLTDARMPDAKAKAESDGSRVAAPVTGPTVARIPVRGVLVQRSLGELFDWWFGLVGYDTIRREIDAAVADPNVREIVLDIDSPGGSVAGCFDLTDFIAEAREQKPITAIVDEMACSAAYAIASACTRIVAPRTALVGSIGVIATHVDWSAWNERVGLKVTHIFAGAHKADWSGDAPLSKEAHAELQARIDGMYDLFVGSVARYRGMDEKALRSTEARVYGAEAAKALGLIDEVAPADKAFGAVVARLDEEPELPADEPKPEDAEPSAKADVPMASGGLVGRPAAAVDAVPVLLSRGESNLSEIVEKAVAAERAKAAEVLAICGTFRGKDPFALASKLVAKGASLDEVRAIAAADAVAADPETLSAVDATSSGPNPGEFLANAMRTVRKERRN